MPQVRTYTVFVGVRKLVSGSIGAVLAKTKSYLDSQGSETVLIFENETGQQVEFDFSGTPDEVLQRVAAEQESIPNVERPKVGRPKLGVAAREISLLPSHWDWLNRQPGKASGTLRRLVETAKTKGRGRELARNARDAAHGFMWNMAGNLPNFEAASRALYAKDQEGLFSLIADWPTDIREHAEYLVGEATRLDIEAEEKNGFTTS